MSDEVTVFYPSRANHFLGETINPEPKYVRLNRYKTVKTLAMFSFKKKNRMSLIVNHVYSIIYCVLSTNTWQHIDRMEVVQAHRRWVRITFDPF